MTELLTFTIAFLCKPTRYPTSTWRPRALWNFAEIFGPGLSYGVVCVILDLAVLVEHRLVTDGRTDTQ